MFLSCTRILLLILYLCIIALRMRCFLMLIIILSFLILSFSWKLHAVVNTVLLSGEVEGEEAAGVLQCA